MVIVISNVITKADREKNTKHIKSIDTLVNASVKNETRVVVWSKEIIH